MQRQESDNQMFKGRKEVSWKIHGGLTDSTYKRIYPTSTGLSSKFYELP